MADDGNAFSFSALDQSDGEEGHESEERSHPASPGPQAPTAADGAPGVIGATFDDNSAGGWLQSQGRKKEARERSDSNPGPRRQAPGPTQASASQQPAAEAPARSDHALWGRAPGRHEPQRAKSWDKKRGVCSAARSVPPSRRRARRREDSPRSAYSAARAARSCPLPAAGDAGALPRP